jgi:hypothetical protein
VKDAELPQRGTAVIVDFFPGQTVFGVEGVHTAQRELDSPPCRGQPAPISKMRPADNYLNQNGLLRHMLAFYVDLQVGERLHQLCVEKPHAIAILVMFVPRFIVVSGSIAEGAKDCFEVVLVFQPNVFFDNGDTG